MAKRPRWKTEAEICDAIESRAGEFFDLEQKDFRLIREFDIDGHRADFALFQRSPRKVTLVEVKITADIWAIDQCAKYVRRLSEKFLWWSAKTGAREELQIEGEVWARWIDDSVWNLARTSNIMLSKIDLADDNLSICIEPYPVTSTDLSDDISKLFDAIHGAQWPE